MDVEESHGLNLNIQRLHLAEFLAKELRTLKADIANAPLPANKNAKKRVFAEMKMLSDITAEPQELIESIIEDGLIVESTRLDELHDLVDELSSKHPDVEGIPPPSDPSVGVRWLDGVGFLGGDPDDPWFAMGNEDYDHDEVDE